MLFLSAEIVLFILFSLGIACYGFVITAFYAVSLFVLIEFNFLDLRSKLIIFYSDSGSYWALYVKIVFDFLSLV